jgi:hypothetical protein
VTAFSRHLPRRRMIQYAALPMFNSAATEYWMPAFTGMTT